MACHQPDAPARAALAGASGWWRLFRLLLRGSLGGGLPPFSCVARQGPQLLPRLVGLVSFHVVEGLAELDAQPRLIADDAAVRPLRVVGRQRHAVGVDDLVAD